MTKRKIFALLICILLVIGILAGITFADDTSDSISDLSFSSLVTVVLQI